ncbi:hypothetical protein [Mesorhizobium sp.]|uniref:hypothetical protein n=1 Tax=Mesorhizobium sp. TaxID=1871066 RepID=UPI0034506638
MTERLLCAPTLHRVVKHNGIAYIGGIVADGDSQDMAGQTREVLAKLDTYLKEARSDRSKLLARHECQTGDGRGVERVVRAGRPASPRNDRYC